MSTYVCLLRKEENQLVTTLLNSLKNKVNQIDYFSPGININPTKYFYNNIVYFSNEKIEESHLILLKTLFDNNNSSVSTIFLIYKNLCNFQLILIYSLYYFIVFMVCIIYLTFNFYFCL